MKSDKDVLQQKVQTCKLAELRLQQTNGWANKGEQTDARRLEETISQLLRCT